MPFGLNYAGSTYYRLVNLMIKEAIGDFMEVYVDEMILKSLRAGDHLTNLEASFDILNRYQMKLNPTKCTFEVTSEKFLGYLIDRKTLKPTLHRSRQLTRSPLPAQ